MYLPNPANFDDAEPLTLPGFGVVRMPYFDLAAAFGLLTDEALRQLRDRTGVEVPHSRAVHECNSAMARVLDPATA